MWPQEARRRRQHPQLPTEPPQLAQIPHYGINSPEPAHHRPAESSDDGLLRFPGQRMAAAPRTRVRPDASWICDPRRDGAAPLGCAPSERRPPPPLPPRGSQDAASSSRKVIDWQLKHAPSGGETAAADPLGNLRRAQNWPEDLNRAGANPQQPGLDSQAWRNFRRVQRELQTPLKRIADRLTSHENGTAAAAAAAAAVAHGRDAQEHSAGDSEDQPARRHDRRHHRCQRHRQLQEAVQRLERQLCDLRVDSRAAQRRLERRLCDCRQRAEAALDAPAAAFEQRRSCCHRHQRWQPQAPVTDAAEAAAAERELRRLRRWRREASRERDGRSLERRHCDLLRARLGRFAADVAEAADACLGLSGAGSSDCEDAAAAAAGLRRGPGVARE